MSAKVVLITGCSQGGIGAALCDEFAKQGCVVYATARKVEKMEALVHPSIRKLALDVLDEDNIKRVIDHVIATEGKLDILVNNAGVPAFGPTLDVPMDEVTSAFQANVFSILRVSKVVLPHMASRKQGLIINIGSIVGEIPTPFSGIYSATKAAAHSITQNLWMECQPFNVKVMLVAPGGITSNFVATYAPEYRLVPGSLYTDFLPHILRRISASQTPQSMKADVLARMVVGKALGRSPPWYLTAGNNATMFAIAKWFPRTWVLRYMWSLFSKPVKPKTS